MRIVALSCCVAALVACGSNDGDDVATDTAAGATDTAPVASPMSLGDLAGTWNVTAKPESGADTSTTRYTLTATSDTTGWTITFPNRPQAVPVRVVAVQGDSVVTEAGPFQSVRRRNMQVTTRNVLRREGDRLVGSTRARYQTTGSDTVLVLRTEATRAP
ncbi:MAG TPA: hypothetical protein VJ650_08470 [Gemmatimonadaceae bacterium]|nr:hypothetical protein [Gemmatimonadaceae bacterium]